MNEWDEDEDMVWRTTVLHHYLWGKGEGNYDLVPITSNFLPLLLDHKFDAYLNGHEHLSTYSSYPHS